MHKRVIIGIISGAILGIVCVLGANLRSTETLETTYLLAFWFNRVLIGLLVGLISKNVLKLRIVHGALFGALVSFGFYSATNFKDVIGFIAGIVYGVIIAIVIYEFDKAQDKKANKD